MIGDLIVLRISIDALEKSFGDLLHLVGRDRSLPIAVAEELEHSPRRLQLRLVNVEIHSVQGIKLERHVVVDDFGHSAW